MGNTDTEKISDYKNTEAFSFLSKFLVCFPSSIRGLISLDPFAFWCYLSYLSSVERLSRWQVYWERKEKESDGDA